MPWARDHKPRTRQRIVSAASAAFRAGGISGVRVEDVMKRAGLTHGGFYAHFRSKDDLVRASLDEAGAQTIRMLSKSLADADAAERLQAVVDAYLSPAHVRHPELGCPLATLAPEITQTGGATKRKLAEGVKGRLTWMRLLVPESRRGADTDDQIIGTLACMVGGVILARAAGARDSAGILNACRKFLRATAR